MFQILLRQIPSRLHHTISFLFISFTKSILRQLRSIPLFTCSHVSFMFRVMFHPIYVPHFFRATILGLVAIYHY